VHLTNGPYMCRVLPVKWQVRFSPFTVATGGLLQSVEADVHSSKAEEDHKDVAKITALDSERSQGRGNRFYADGKVSSCTTSTHRFS